MRVTIAASQYSTKFYRDGYALGKADAESGYPFSRYVLQHGEVARVDFRGRAVLVTDEHEAFWGQAYVDGCVDHGRDEL